MMATAVPVRNIYYLLCYAWNRLKEGQLVDISATDSNELADLFARILITGINHLQRRGLEQGYELVCDEIPGIRGRVDILVTARRFLQQHARAYCEFDELTVNTAANQILKATLSTLIKVDQLSSKLRADLHRLLLTFWQVENKQLDREAFRRVSLHSNNRHYRFLLSVCALVMRARLVDEQSGVHRFRDFVRDEDLMPKLFEDFVFNFFRIERPDFKVQKEQISWQAKSTVDPTLSYLPGMMTDISLRKLDQTIIIDTKYYRETLQEHYDRRSVHSGHLYQLFAYLKNIEHQGGPNRAAEGILLYPVVTESLDLEYEIHGHKMKICTVNLMQDWKQIDARLRALV